MGDHPIYAALYDRLTAAPEAAGLAERRRQLLSQATGAVLEVGGGTGRNLRWYTRADRLVVLEPDGAMRRRLLARTGECPVPVEVLPVGIDEAGADSVGFPDGCFDTVVCTLVLCSVPDLGSALRAISRILAADGRVLFLEHVAASGVRARAQRLVTPAWAKVVPGCHLDRDVVKGMRECGLVVTECQRFRMPLGPLLDAGAQGVARPASALVGS